MTKKKGLSLGVKVGIAAVGTVAVVVAGTKINKMIKDKQQENAGNLVDSKNPNLASATTLAQRAFAAFNPSGYSFLWDGTDEKELYLIAKELYTKKIPFETFTGVYKKLFQRSFVSDLNNELDSSELTKFYSNLRSGFGSVGVLNPSYNTVKFL